MEGEGGITICLFHLSKSSQYRLLIFNKQLLFFLLLLLLKVPSFSNHASRVVKFNKENLPILEYAMKGNDAPASFVIR